MGRHDNDNSNDMRWANFGLSAFVTLVQLIVDLVRGKKVQSPWVDNGEDPK